MIILGIEIHKARHDGNLFLLENLQVNSTKTWIININYYDREKYGLHEFYCLAPIE